MKQAVWVGMLVGSTVGGMIPNLWGASIFSFSSILFGAAGGIFGIYVAFKMTRP